MEGQQRSVLVLSIQGFRDMDASLVAQRTENGTKKDMAKT
jgi:hypothetical protein